MIQLQDNQNGTLGGIDLETIDTHFGESIVDEVMKCQDSPALYALIRLCSCQIDVLLEAQISRLQRMKP